MTQHTISEQLKAWRTVRGLSQRALGERSGVGFVAIARLELGQTDPRLSSLRKLAAALGVAVGGLVDGSPVKRRMGRRGGKERSA